jgi:hypothetical protein
VAECICIATINNQAAGFTRHESPFAKFGKSTLSHYPQKHSPLFHTVGKFRGDKMSREKVAPLRFFAAKRGRLSPAKN